MWRKGGAVGEEEEGEEEEDAEQRGAFAGVHTVT